MEGVLTQLFDIAIGLIAVVAASFATIGIKRLMTKFGMQVTEEKERAIRAAAQNAILFAEEWGAKRIKLRKMIVTGEEKIDLAIRNLLNKVPGISVAEAKELVEEELPKLGLGAASFIGALGRKIARHPELLVKPPQK